MLQNQSRHLLIQNNLEIYLKQIKDENDFLIISDSCGKEMISIIKHLPNLQIVHICVMVDKKI